MEPDYKGFVNELIGREVLGHPIDRSVLFALSIKYGINDSDDKEVDIPEEWSLIHEGKQE